jgi:hypothetical protein
MSYRMMAAVVIAGTLLVMRAADAGTIWREGEQPTAADVARHPFWYDQVKKDQLSGGDWISNFSDKKVGTVKYAVNVAEPGEHAFWIRANPTATKLSYRLDNGPWQPLATDSAQDAANIAGDEKLDIRFIAWLDGGMLNLTKGQHTIEFRMDSANNNHGAIDCFVLTTDKGFVPQGTLKPGEKAPGAPEAADEPGAWIFRYQENKLDQPAALDLRSLNEKTAGETGFVKLSADGNSFVRGDGQPIRFWAINANFADAKDAARHARFLAKMGVNMVRLHAQLPSKEKDAKITDVDAAEIDKMHRFVAEAKKQGIYCTISPYWASQEAPKSWGLEGYDSVSPWGVMFFNDKLKNAYKEWVRKLYEPKNPYTGIPLSQDPAVAIIQIKNEDSLLFWTTQGIKPEQQKVLGKKFGEWLKKKYGSLDKALAAWEGDKHENDRFGEGVVGILMIYEMTQDRTGGRAKRLDDQTQFFTETQRAFYADIVDFYRKDLGCKQLINATNWITADPIRLNDLERYTYTATDVLAVNRYYTGVHIGPNNGWRIDPGDKFTSPSALLNVRNLPANLKQVVGHPMLITESTWVHPLDYQSEGPLLMAAYQSLTGVDAFYWFAASKAEYDLSPFFPFVRVNGDFPHHKWTCSTPDLIGMFPATALMFRRGYLKQGEPVVHEERTLEEMFQRKVPLIAEDASFDPNRFAGKTGSAASVIKGGVNPLAFLVGPVEVKYGGDPSKSTAADLSKYVDESAKTIKSVTGEIVTNYGQGFTTINAPQAQAATGFLTKAGGPIKLADVTLTSGNDYATIAVVAMDDQPIATSTRLLVQVGTRAYTSGWKQKPASFPSEDKKTTIDGFEVVSTGKPPWRVVNTDVTIAINNAGLKKATLLDPNGFAKQDLTGERQGNTFTLKLPSDAMYVILE